MAKHKNFSAGLVAGFEFKPSARGKSNQTVYWDGKTPGLGLRVTPAGAKSFIFQTEINGKSLRTTIGDTRTWTIGKAQAEATRLKGMTDQGIDPREIKREKAEAKAAAIVAKQAAQTEAERRQQYTLRALCKAYTDMLEAKGKARSAAATTSAFKCHVLEAHPKIADTPANEVTAHQVAAMVRVVREAGKMRSAGILRSYLSAAFNAAKKAPFDASLPAALIPFDIATNPVDNIPAIAVKAGERTLSAIELRAYMASLGADLTDRALTLALLAGGQRMAQLLRAKVSDYNPDTATLRLWDGKGKRKQGPREHLLPLAPKAAELVTELVTRANENQSTWLFSTHGTVPMTFTTPGNRAAKISAAMKGELFDLRDIRRTVETMLASMEISKDTRAQLLSHGLSGVQASNYDKHDYTKVKRNALVAWEQRLDEIATGNQASNVIQLTKKSNAAA